MLGDDDLDPSTGHSREHARLAAAGVSILREPATEPWGLIEMRNEDPDGSGIVLVEVTPVRICRIYDWLVRESRGEAGGSFRLAAALILSSLDVLVCGHFEVVRSRAGSRVAAGPFASHSGDAGPLAVFA